MFGRSVELDRNGSGRDSELGFSRLGISCSLQVLRPALAGRPGGDLHNHYPHRTVGEPGDSESSSAGGFASRGLVLDS